MNNKILFLLKNNNKKDKVQYERPSFLSLLLLLPTIKCILILNIEKISLQMETPTKSLNKRVRIRILYIYINKIFI